MRTDGFVSILQITQAPKGDYDEIMMPHRDDAVMESIHKCIDDHITKRVRRMISCRPSSIALDVFGIC